METNHDFSIEELGKRSVKSPIRLSNIRGDFIANYVVDDEFVRMDVDVSLGDQPSVERKQVFERAGPREMLYFIPKHVHAGIVTCGGLCPGINDVIRAVVRCLYNRYGVHRISGIRYGFKGLNLYGPAHGTGLQECEGPWVDNRGSLVMEPNMVFNIDVWIADEKYGVRFEDGVLITEKGVEELSSWRREIIRIK